MMLGLSLGLKLFFSELVFAFLIGLFGFIFAFKLTERSKLLVSILVVLLICAMAITLLLSIWEII